MQRNAAPTISAADLRTACAAWGRTPATGSGALGFGLWMQRWAERQGRKSFTVIEYGTILSQVRAKIDDTTDYATFYDEANDDDLD